MKRAGIVGVYGHAEGYRKTEGDRVAVTQALERIARARRTQRLAAAIAVASQASTNPDTQSVPEAAASESPDDLPLQESE